MSAKAIREFDGKLLLSKYLFSSPELSEGKEEAPAEPAFAFSQSKVAQVSFEMPKEPTPASIKNEIASKLFQAEKNYPWLLTTKLVVKPDQLIKRRGKSGLLAINKTWEEVKQWISDRALKEVT
ncbi:hypothetical protein BB560_004714, partial [Smittium megazygosporum]